MNEQTFKSIVEELQEKQSEIMDWNIEEE